ncbi:MAG TPA: hypothetical protein VNL77_09280 [Roseiflexaceae bacterium]|nr:hypothetical protein [Roseiflexaceae bacterium]
MSERKRKQPGWGAALSWLIFLLVIAGGPLLRALQGALGGGVQLTNYLPYLIGALLLLSFAASAVRALGGRRRAERTPTLPERAGPTAPAGQPMPPFGGDAGPHLPPLGGELRSPYAPPVQPSELRRLSMPSERPLRAPQFEPLLPPVALAVGVLGVIALCGAALVVFGVGTP